jgi:hypothetical protein
VCVDTWPQAWTDAGFTFESANIQALCVQAECVFMCAESPTGPQELIEDTQNCGACGNVCASDAANSLDDVCVGAQCHCVLTEDGEQGLLGNTCNGRCTLGGLNCQAGCCPDARAGNNVIPAHGNADDKVAYQFVIERAEGILLAPPANCDRVDFQLITYDDDGFVYALNVPTACSPVRFPLLSPGQYTIMVSPERERESAFQFTRLPFESDFDAPGMVERAAVGTNTYATFRIPDAGLWEIGFDNLGGNCGGAGALFLYDSAGELVRILDDNPACSVALDGGWVGVLEPGTYMAVGEARRLAGNYRVSVRLIDPDPGQVLPMVIRFDGFGRNGSATVPFRFDEAGRYRVTTAGPGGGGCPGDTVLSLRGPGGEELANNDDDDRVPGNCSRVFYDFEANTNYQAVITGYDGGAVGDGTIVLDWP